jgi:exopolysaccharide biosynthesis WecB/TagA/CpsF family protein
MSFIIIEDDIINLKNNKFVTLNLEIYLLLIKNKSYCDSLKEWSYVCDSRIIQYYLYFFYNRNVVLNQGHRLIHTFIEKGMNHFLFLGSTLENLKLAKTNVQKQYENLIIDIDPLIAFENSQSLDIALDLRTKYDFDKYDAIFVALGAPKQDLLIANINCKSLIFGCGGTFEFLSNKASYPPYIIEVLGLTFLWRLLEDFTISRIKKILRTFKGAFCLLLRRDIN